MSTFWEEKNVYLKTYLDKKYDKYESFTTNQPK